MKKLLCITLALLLTLVMVACASPSTSTKESSTTEVTQSDSNSDTEANIVLYDKNDIVITFKGQNNSKSLGPALKILIENNFKEPIVIQDFNCSINGFSTDPIFTIRVDAGQKSDSLMEFIASILEKDGIEVIETVEFKLKILSTETWMEIDRTDAITVTP